MSSTGTESGMTQTTSTLCYRKIPGSVRRLLWTAACKPSRHLFPTISTHSMKTLSRTVTRHWRRPQLIGSSILIRCVTSFSSISFAILTLVFSSQFRRSGTPSSRCCLVSHLEQPRGSRYQLPEERGVVLSIHSSRRCFCSGNV